MSDIFERAAAAALFIGVLATTSAQGAAVYTGDTIQGRRVMQILHDSPKPECDSDGDGCGEEESDYLE